MTCIPCVLGTFAYILLGLLMSLGLILGYKWRRFIAKLMRKINKKKTLKPPIETNRFLREDEK